MKGDFTRDTFDPTKRYSRVLSQQGRVTLDADANEQASIALYQQRTFIRDLLGPYAGPQRDLGFVMTVAEDGLWIEPGRYYVDGILVENPTRVRYVEQPDLVLVNDPLQKALKDGTQTKSYWLYLDVWERHITWIEDGSIREKALGGPDTTTRSRVVWQVRAVEQTAGLKPAAGGNPCDDPIADLFALSDAGMAARVDPGAVTDDPCIQPPDSKYRGPENQLYRVEIHQGGTAGTATFKWSRDNGCIATPFEVNKGKVLGTFPRGFEALDWIEVVDDVLELQGVPGLLAQIAGVQDGEFQIEDSTVLDRIAAALDTAVNPKIRRWNQSANDATTLTDGAIALSEGTGDGDWIDLEYGLQVRFAPGGTYRTGDYWLIPAREATGTIEWPSEPGSEGVPTTVEAHGVEHHFAPLGVLSWSDGTGSVSNCMCSFMTASPCFQEIEGGSSRGKTLPRRFIPKPVQAEIKPARGKRNRAGQ